MLDAYGRTVGAVSRALLWICVAALVAAVGLNAIEIVARYFFGSSSLYRVEIALELCTALYLIGYVVLLAGDEDVRMEYFYERMPPSARLTLDLAIAAATLWFFWVLFDSALLFYRLTSTMTHPTFPISRGITTVPVLVAAAGCLWVSIYQLLATIRRLWDGPASGPSRDAPAA